MNEIYTKDFFIRTTETDLYDIVRPSALLGYLQEMATSHAVLLHIDRDYLVEHYNACWILVRTWFRLLRPLKVGETLTISTWHRGAGGLTIYRDYDLYVGQEQVGEATAAWVIADLQSRKMLRPAAVENMASSPVPDTVKDKQLRLIKTPKERQICYQRTVRYSDLDVNGHMNNTKYADVLLDALSPEELSGRFLSELQLNYSQECKAGETMEISRVLDGNSCYIDGCSGDGKRRFEASLQFAAYSGNSLDEVPESE
jgi:acyl-ACP thioesterase